MPTIPVSSGTWPVGKCPSSYQNLADTLASILSVNITSTTGFVISSTKPSNTALVWFRIDSLGRFLGMYVFGQGAWLSAHPVASGLTMWWFNALPDFTTFDGGDTGGIGPASGPMWQQAKDGNGTLISASFLIAAGTLPSSKVLALGGTGGEENHTLTVSEGAQDSAHNHVLGRIKETSDNWGMFFSEASSNTINGTVISVTTAGGTGTSQDISACSGPYLRSGIIDPTPGTIVGHNNIPPYVVGYLLQRTSRIFYSVI